LELYVEQANFEICESAVGFLGACGGYGSLRGTLWNREQCFATRSELLGCLTAFRGSSGLCSTTDFRAFAIAGPNFSLSQLLNARYCSCRRSTNTPSNASNPPRLTSRYTPLPFSLSIPTPLFRRGFPNHFSFNLEPV
jgi:hypothetical protein